MRSPLGLLVVLLALPVAAQEGGRTDGPEGAEIGKGGYTSASEVSAFSLALNWGASVNLAPLNGVGAPLYLGATASYWVTDWFAAELHGAYAFNTSRVFSYLGPRFRTPTYPVSGGIGLRAGAIFDPFQGVRFGLSPVASVDLILQRHFLASLEACFDIPIAGNGTTTRIGLTLGWRF